MTSSEYFSNYEPWLYKTAPFSDTWLSESFARDNETLTLALQNSICSDTSSLSPIFSPGLSANSGSSEPPPPPPYQKKRSSIPVSAKPTKRRTRASKKATTTFINATPANFRQMVQQVTGVFIPEEYPMRPEPMRSGGRLQGGCMPTLDTSSFLLEQQLQFQQQQTFPTPAAVAASVLSPAVPADGGGGNGFDFDSFFGLFPTLESFEN